MSLVYARAFSFTDASVNVEFPTMKTAIPAQETKPMLNGPRSTEPAVLLLRLRCLQSNWYQELFQSGRQSSPDDVPYIYQMCSEMHQWSQTLPDTLPSTYKEYFELELLYSYVYCLAPIFRANHVPRYGKALIFEYCIAYMQKFFPISQDLVSVFYTYHDALRVFFVASQFLEVFCDNQDQLLDGVPVPSPITRSSPAPPPLPPGAGSHNVNRSINCINQIKETLGTFGKRWGNAGALLSSFEIHAETLVNSLHKRRLENSSELPQTAALDHLNGIVKAEWSNESDNLSQSIYADIRLEQGQSPTPMNGVSG